MNLKKLFRYSFLPILAVLIIPNWSKETIPNEMDLVIYSEHSSFVNLKSLEFQIEQCF